MGIFRMLALVALLLVPWGNLGSVQADTTADRLAASKLVARAGKIAQTVAKLRGLALKSKIERGVMSKSQIRARILKILDREYTPEELAAESLGLKRLGLIPEKADYAKVMVDMLQDQIAGFYDQHEKKLYIAGWAQAGGEMLMAHEIDHALQDQHFDLGKFMAADRKNGDSMAARQALLEGDGVALMLEFEMAAANQAPPWGNPMVMGVLRRGLAQGASSLSHVPLALREGLLFPYVGGVEFVAHFRKHHSWRSIDAMYKRPPLSTEHILHPKKYESYELPIAIAAERPKSLAGYAEKVSNVIGEKGVELFLRTHGVELQRAVVAGAGWGGDRLAVYAGAGHRGSALPKTVGVWQTSWDEERDAAEFFEALEHALPSLAGSKGQSGKHRLSFEAKGLVLIAERRGSLVLLLFGAPKNTSDALRLEVWHQWQGTSSRP
ncbi:MAG: hypothetical protein GY811_24220 [Myxococcales bacterium]|nr:hypothetical protein [Myxococcales bacterium]